MTNTLIKKPIYIIFLFCFSCRSAEKEPKNDSRISPVPATDSPVNCYRYVKEKDTITLKLVHIGESITGTLVYNFYEKDKSKGTIQGSMKQSLLLADYTFMSEGKTSVRQVAFKKEGNYFIEGYGEVISNADKVTFKNVDSLQFNSTKLVEINCQ